MKIGTVVTVEVPAWFAKQNECATAMQGEIIAESGKAVRFRGHIQAREATHCLICGRELTHPVSLVVGIGPVCARRLNIDRSAYESLPAEELARLIAEHTIEVWIPKSVAVVDGEPLGAEAPERSDGAEPSESSTARKTDSLADRVERVFRETFAAKMSGYEAREPQVQMARLVAQGLEGGRHVTAEAGTGTGKSYAVVVPAVHHAKVIGMPVIISTGTIALQEQYVRDVQRLKEILDTPFTATLAKGKGNYVCKLRLESEAKQPGLPGQEDLGAPSTELLEWALRSKTGDRADYPGVPDPVQWSQINADDTCIGAKCPFYDSCHYFTAKREAAEADVVICNHHLFFADMVVKQATDGWGGVLPPACAVVFDEAHHLESIARSSLGTQASNYKTAHWIRQVRKLPFLIDPDIYEGLQRASDQLFTALGDAMEEDRSDIPTVNPLLEVSFGQAMESVIKQMQREAGALATEDQERAERLVAQGFDFIDFVKSALSGVTEENHVHWAEREHRPAGTKVTLHASPIDVSGILREQLFKAYSSVVLTSATISVDGQFDHLKGRLGIEDPLEMIVDSPFNYREQCLLYCPPPASMPDPAGGNRDYHAQIAPHIEELLRLTSGRAFVLFTSYRGLREVYDRIAHKLPWTVLRQGEDSRARLVERFKADEHSVLFGTRTFWEGISIEGEALSCVIIDKLPFPVPSDPVAKAIAASVEASGQSPFFELSLPEAVLAVKQGAGRLIRTKSDRGVIAILDKRIRTKTYGHAFLRSLPRARRVERLADIEAFMTAERGETA